jgi:signal transduction histidine kinase
MSENERIQRETEARKVYETYWESYASGDLETFASTIDETYEMIGTSESEVCHTKADGINFLKGQIKEITGKAELRNRQIEVIPVDQLMLVNEHCDIYVLADSDWNFYSKIRISTLIRETEMGWKVVQQHGSLPDMRVHDGETLAIDKISRENLELRDAIKRRTIELEQKNRELKIETAIERVRAQTMAMHHSDDLDKVNKEILNQLNWLQMPGLTGVTFYLTDERGWVKAWDFSSPGNMGDQNSYTLQFDFKKYEMMGEPFKILRQTDLNYFVADYPREKLELAVYELEEINPAVANAFREALAKGILTHQWTACARISDGLLGIDLVSPPSGDTKTIVLKIAGAFNQAYQRFLDLQKAEAQVREAQTEAALENVRSSSLAMQNSGQIREIVKVVFEKLKELKFAIDGGVFVGTISNNSDYVNFWIGDDHAEYPDSYKLPKYDAPTISDVWDARKSGAEFISKTYSFKEKNIWFEYAFNHTDLKTALPEDFKKWILEQEYLTQSFAMQKNSMIGVHFHHAKTLTENEIDILKRFSRVFEQSYIRFLDLQKAEAQAREAQIEAALERVRSRSLAMHRSDELEQVAASLFEAIVGLGIAMDGALLFVFDRKKRNITLWVTIVQLNNPVLINLPYEEEMKDNEIIFDYWKATDQGQALSKVYTGETKNEYFRYVQRHNSSKISEQAKKLLIDLPAWHLSFAAEKNTMLGLDSWSGHLFTESDLNTLRKFARAFEQAYVRFLDLQKAEAQAREAQIEAALERVRSRSMGMQKSEELREIIQVIYEQFVHLDIHVDSAGFGTDYMESDDFNFWFADSYSTYPKKVHIPYFDHPQFNSLTEAKAKGVDFYANSLTFDEKNEFFDHVFKNSPPIPQEFKDALYSAPGYVSSHAILKNLVLYILNYTDVPFSDEENAILMRFGKAFEQAYTRFLDLQKAEAQAREAQIETALEKVRSRSLAMHKSDELQEVINNVYNRLNELDIKMDAVNIDIFQDSGREFDVWVASPRGNFSARIHIPDIEFGPSKVLMDARENGDEFCVYKCSFEEKNKWFNFVFEHTDFRHVPEDRKRYILEGKFWNVAFAIFRNSAIQLNSYSLESFTERDISILQRFGKVFEQAYIRFLDLQKAEAQAREAQIEASLERLRSKTMAMHNSHDVGESVATMFDELARLEVKTKRCGVLIHGNPVNTEVWTARSNPEGKAALIIGHLDMTVHPLLSGARNSWLNKESSFSYVLEGEDIKNYFRAINDTKTYPHHFNIRTLPPKEFHSDFHFRDGSIFAFTAEPIPAEALLIFNRFASVFGQTYRRFLDLQKAEAQAREAQIEAALERVRSKAMAMHNSEDLNATIAAFYRELEQFSITPRRCGVGLLQKNRVAELSTMNTMEHGNSIEIIGILKMEGHWVLDGVYDNWILQKEFHPVLRGNEIKEYNQLLRPQVAFPEYPNDSAQFGYFFFFPEGGVYAWTEKEMKEDELNIYRRFTRVLSLTYKRYKDLKDAEANALEAVRRASLDRVRAEIASMRTVDDLQRITPIIWHELTSLGVPFVRCGVFIIEEATEHIQVHLSSPDGSALGALDLPFNSSELTLNSVNHWRQGIIFKTHWNKQEFLNFMQSMIKLGQISNPETYQGAAQPPESLHLHFVPFKQGMLYVGNTFPLEKEALELVKALAESFSIAYARYEDFSQLELAKNQIEKTFTELKAAQAQLIQAEKMASLGELTAGIAHEIQNPLNFVNNFSEISNELMDEMKEELEESSRQYAAGSMQSGEEKLKIAEEIAGDIKQNLEKINHHGKRAADIVKGMLQHSRTSSGQKEPTDINALSDEYLRLAYHGLRAKDKSFNADFKTDFDPNLPKINVIPQDFGRVLLNLINNAFYAVGAHPPPKGGIKERGTDYKPTVIVRTSSWNPPSGGRGASISVIDNGPGIPAHIVDKIFQPFFTTKPTGQGTGLGLSLSYDIVKAHGGELKVDSQEGIGTVFSVILKNKDL